MEKRGGGGDIQVDGETGRERQKVGGREVERETGGGRDRQVEGETGGLRNR